VEHGQQKSRGEVNVQDNFFNTLRRDERPVHIYLLTGKRISGVLRRFDRYALVIENNGHEYLVYKHAVASVSLARAEGERGAAESV